MASITYVIAVRDSSVTSGDNRKTGLTPTFIQLKKLSDNSNITGGNIPTISEIGLGQYKFSFDAESLGEAAYQIDAGNTLTNPSDRYIDGVLTIDSSRIATNLNAAVSTRAQPSDVQINVGIGG